MIRLFNTIKCQWGYFLILSFTILMLYRCYYFIGFASYTFRMGLVAFVLYLFMIFRGKSSFFQRNFRIEFLILCFTFITFFVSILYYNQNVSNIARFLLPLSFIPYFYIIRNRVSLDTVEKVLCLFGILYLICWLYQTSQLPDIVFGEREAVMGERGFYRFYIATKEHFPFLIFYFLALYNRCKKNLFLILALFVFCITILHVARQMIVWSGLLAMIYFLYTNGKKIKTILVFSVIAFWGFSFFTENFTVVNDLIEMTENSKDGINSADSNNIRFKAMKSFISDFNLNPITFLFGNGFAENGSLLDFRYKLFSNKGYFIDDVGFIGLFVTQGLLTLLLYIKLLFDVLFKYDVQDKYVYLKFYIAYLVMSYLGSHALTSNIIFAVLAIYIIKVSSINKRTEMI